MPNPPPADSITLPPEPIKRLSKASTATVATVAVQTGLYHNAYVQGVLPLAQGKATLVGPAFTLPYIPARPDTDPVEAFREPALPQRVAVEECLKVQFWLWTAEETPRRTLLVRSF